MTTEEKLVKVAENREKLYDGGVETGKKAEYDRFWDSYQENGQRWHYSYAFAGAAWNDDNMIPKYEPIRYVNDKWQYANFQYMFYWNQQITKTMRIIVDKGISLNGLITQCTKLKELYLEGEIGRNLDAKNSPLSVACMKRLIGILANYAGTTDEYKYSITFSDSCWAALEADSTSPSGGTWKDYVIQLGWNT
jgi:hypothetical protein